MTRLTRTLVAAALALAAIATPVMAQKSYTIAPVPQFEERKLVAAWQPVVDYLNSATHHHFELKLYPDIPAFEKGYATAEYDFGYMNPYHLVVANEKQGYLPILRDHGAKLSGVLVVQANGSIESPSDLNGKLVAFPSPNALGATLQMRQELLDKFGAKVIPQYMDTHDAVYLNVKLGGVAAGGGVQKTLERQPLQVRNELRVLHETDKVHPHPIAALPSVPEQVRQEVVDALLKLGESEEGRKLLAALPMKKIGTATLADYEPLKSMHLERFYEEPK